MTPSKVVASNLFDTFLMQLRSGDDFAIGEFLAKYEPYIRRTLRFRIARASLQPVADSVDVCQSVLGSFLLRLSAGEYELHNEEELRALLVSIANKKFLMLQRREKAAKRDRRITVSLSDPMGVPSDEISVAKHFAQEELLKEVARRFTSQEHELFRQRSAGKSWESISAQLGEDSGTLRQRLSRAINRVAVELKLEDADERT